MKIIFIVYHQTNSTSCDQILKKVKKGKDVIEYCQQKFKGFSGFEKAGTRLKYLINAFISDNKEEGLLEVISEVVEMNEENGLK
ncbi:hypothetical protein MWH28_09645 [Natroniella sulfidigena]|uniref:hypothetical protein n=1 Tax=Natroniella sulfidigena TaxID=723921 RepID=UPI00200B8015|nr:hypothetical protein [Natroniella sulfidigena]MCK8817620.1 hypothetical protein [Natroniella sulfidigena]